jgi:DNA-binding NtrC family response regulator
MERLLSRPWRGNVRELANALERALIVARGGELDLSDLSEQSSASASSGPGVTGAAETFDVAARKVVETALKACAGKIYGKDGAAARLGMAPSTLQGKMRRLGVRRRNFEAR